MIEFEKGLINVNQNRKSWGIKKIDFEKLFDSSSRRKDGGRRERMHIQVGWYVGGHTWMDRV